MTRTLFFSACLAGSLALPCAAQIPMTPVPHAGDITMVSEDGTLDGKMFRTATHMRLDMAVDGNDASSIIDMENRKVSAMVDVGMGQPVVMDMDLAKFGPAATEPGEDAVKTGERKTVSGEACDVYRDAEQKADICVTPDGIVMEAVGKDGSMTLSNVVRGPQDASLFVLPAGGMDLGDLMQQALEDADPDDAEQIGKMLEGMFD